jgi:MFS family permease
MNLIVQGIKKHYGLDNRSTLLFFGASFLVQAAIGAIGVLLNLYILALGFSEDFAGTVMSAKLLATGIVCLPAGLLCSRWGVSRTLIAGSAALGLGILLVSLTASPWLLLAGAVLIGSALAVKTVCVPLFLVENSSPRTRQNLFSLNFSLMMLANMAGTALSGFLPEMWTDTQAGLAGTLGFYGLLALISVLPLVLIASNKRVIPASRRQSILDFPLILKDKNLVRLLITHSLIGFGAGFIIPLFNIFMSKKLGASPGQIGVIMSIGQISTALGGLLVPLVVNRLGQVTAIVVLRLASIPFLILIANINNLYGLGAAYFIRTTLMNMTNPAESSFTMELAGEKRVAMSSLLSSMNTITRAISVLASGWIMTRYSYGVPYYLTCVLYAITTVLFLVWFRPQKQATNQPAH